MIVANYDATFAVASTRRGAPRKDLHGIRNRRRNIYAFLEVLMVWLGRLSTATVHPWRLRVIDPGYTRHPLDIWVVLLEPVKPAIFLILDHFEHLGPYCHCLPSFLEQTIDISSTIPVSVAAVLLAEVIVCLSSSSDIV